MKSALLADTLQTVGLPSPTIKSAIVCLVWWVGLLQMPTRMLVPCVPKNPIKMNQEKWCGKLDVLKKSGSELSVCVFWLCVGRGGDSHCFGGAMFFS